MAQETAVDWFAKQVEENLGWYPVDIIKEAKEMEREQHYYSCVNVIEGVLNKVEKGEKTNSRDVFNQYYNKTYGNNQNK